MHASVYGWVRDAVAIHGLGGRVLEVGAMNLNGTVRDHFDHADEYIATDMRAGPGVDSIMLAHQAADAYGPASFDGVVSCEVLEHDPRFWLSLPALGDVLAPGGWLILTTRGIGFPYHSFPGDFWRFTLETAPILMELAGCTVVEAIEDPDPASPGICILGRRS